MLRRANAVIALPAVRHEGIGELILAGSMGDSTAMHLGALEVGGTDAFIEG
jgi:hypothetical protein